MEQAASLSADYNDAVAIPLKRRWFQFSLRTLLAFTTVAGFGLGYIAYERHLAQRQQLLKADLAKQKIHILGFKSPRPDWLKRLLGDDTAGRARSVVIRGGLAARSPAALDRVATNLKQLPSAVTLIFEDPRIDDESLGHFRGLTHLQYVWLNKTQVTDRGLNELREFRHLRQLNVMATQIGDGGLREIVRHQDLETLGLGGTRVTDAGLRELTALPKLAWLNLANTKMTNQGLQEIQKLSALQEVVLTGTQVTDTGVKKLQQAMPNLVICHESLPQNKESPIYGPQ